MKSQAVKRLRFLSEGAANRGKEKKENKNFHDEIVDKAVLYAFKEIQDQFGYQTSVQIDNKNK